MTNEIFEKGYKLLLRYFKEIGRYNDFKKITAKNNPLYKKTIKENFDKWKHGWSQFFYYTWYVGTDYEQYNDPGLNKLREGWTEFIKQNCPTLFK